MKITRTLALTAAFVFSAAIFAAAQYRGTYIPKYAYPIHAAPSLATLARPAVLHLDASQVWRGLIYVHETIPVRPGPFTLVYPKWVPGEHGPTGPIDELAMLRITAHGRPIMWHRGLADMYAFHIRVPAGVHAITARFTLIMNDASGVMATRTVAILNWNRAVLYQAGVDSHTWFVKPSITLSTGWRFGTALTRRGPARNATTHFHRLTLAMLVDSPLDMGRFVKKWTLWRQGPACVKLDMFAGNPKDLDIPAKVKAAYFHVPAEAFALYGSRHFACYHALLTLSNQIGFQGIEHHQSSDDRAPADFMTNPALALIGGDLITHEFSHSWNGKYRRPADLATPNFQVPMRTDLLWVYEGMNQYLGDLLSFRSGIRKPADYPQYLATLYAQMATEPGRATTPVVALTTAAPYLYQASNEYASISRTAGDFYTEGELVWLDVDSIIRQLSHGKKSLDTFLHLYSAPAVTNPITKTYTRADIERLLNEVQPYHWHAFFQKHIYDIAPLPPTSELARTGWKLVYNAKPNPFLQARTALMHGGGIYWYDLGFNVLGNGKVISLLKNSPAWKAGMAQGDRITAVNGRAFSVSELNYALTQARHNPAPIKLQIVGSGWYHTLSIAYYGGARFPHLARIPGTPNLLARIMAPHAK